MVETPGIGGDSSEGDQRFSVKAISSFVEADQQFSQPR
jgi:hypothetical protein